MPVYKALDPVLTADIAEPNVPLFRCLDAQHRPTVCNKDHADYTDALRTWGRTLQAKLKEIRELQPTPSTTRP